MNATTVAVDLAKNVFELAAADERWKVVEKSRLTRGQLERWFQNRSVRLVVMEACATAHYWARTLRARGVEVRLLPAKYVRAYVRRNKTDAADALALLEAARSSDITPVAVKSVEQQALQALHRLRSGWMATRTRRINTLRGFCREFGMEVSVGAARGLAQIARLLADEHSAIPALLRGRCRCGRRGQRARQGRRGAHLGVPYSARCRARVPPGAAEPRSSAAAHPSICAR
jgi:transposase